MPCYVFMEVISMILVAVIATMRDLKKKEKLVQAAGETFGKTLTLQALDVCSDDSVRQCIDGIKDHHIDILSESRPHGESTLCPLTS